MSRGTARMRIAIVDDEPLMANLVSDMLSSTAVDTELFYLAADFLKSREIFSFDTLILDLSLPDIDGFELMDRIAPMGLACSLVLMTGHAQAALQASSLYAKGIGLDVRAAICKPFSRDELLMAIGIPA